MDFETVESFVAIGHHAKTVGHPEASQIVESVATDPGPVVRQVVESMEVHILHHPLHALTVVVVEGAVTATLFRPEVDHLTDIVEGVGNT